MGLEAQALHLVIAVGLLPGPGLCEGKRGLGLPVSLSPTKGSSAITPGGGSEHPEGKGKREGTGLFSCSQKARACWAGARVWF